jgi:membrane dipeptidase
METKSFRIVDLHSDVPLDITNRRAKGERSVLERYHLKKLRQGLVTAVITPIWLESSYKPEGALRRGLQIADAFANDLVDSPSFAFVRHYQDLLDAEAEGKIGLILGAEGGEFIEDDLGLLRTFYRLGLRCFGFCWNQRNLMADGWSHFKDDRGLTDFGRQVVDEVNRLGVLIDLAHMSRKGFWGVLDATRKPLIVSHTCTLLDPSFRAMRDEQLKAVASNGGIIGIIAVRGVGDRTVYPTIPDLKTYCDHIEYAVKVAGPEHVGLGPDFYDYFIEDLVTEYPDMKYELVEGLEDHSKLGAVISELSKRGLTDDEIRMIARDNFVRVFKEVVG